MPHYRDGTEARIGDIVRGKSYNERGKDGELRELIGTLVHLDPSSEACNVRVVFVESGNLPEDFDLIRYQTDTFLPVPREALIDMGEWSWHAVRQDYGQADHFELVLRP